MAEDLTTAVDLQKCPAKDLRGQVTQMVLTLKIILILEEANTSLITQRIHTFCRTRRFVAMFIGNPRL
jgi:hypothetical protein